MVADLETEPRFPWSDGGWQAPVDRGDEVLYFVPAPVSHVSLVRSDGTTEGSGIITQIGPGAIRVSHAATAKDRTVFHLQFDDSVPSARGNELWVTDGTEAGTKSLMPTSGRVSNFVELDGVLFFQQGSELWQTDGTVDGTMAVFEAPLLNEFSDGPITTLDDRIVFFAEDGTTGVELWATDQATRQPLPLTNFPDSVSPETLMGDGQSLFVVARDTETSIRQLWLVDDSPDGASFVDVLAEPIDAWVLANDDLFF